jgi:hypothetical protein
MTNIIFTPDVDWCTTVRLRGAKIGGGVIT